MSRPLRKRHRAWANTMHINLLDRAKLSKAQRESCIVKTMKKNGNKTVYNGNCHLKQTQLDTLPFFSLMIFVESAACCHVSWKLKVLKVLSCCIWSSDPALGVLVLQICAWEACGYPKQKHSCRFCGGRLGRSMARGESSEYLLVFEGVKAPQSVEALQGGLSGVPKMIVYKKIFFDNMLNPDIFWNPFN